ncbi:MAG: hypothetical protein Q605_AUC01118G0001, partial [Actinomyces urogenitalis DORA_12]
PRSVQPAAGAGAAIAAEAWVSRALGEARGKEVNTGAVWQVGLTAA